ncbi:MAG: hypothetical protein GSR77_05040 [Desulfurococcales archaeon]|nr:hypothetical protein [Desulfurococcales archaeon]MEB3765511.1 hypothetical protein [Desulfurococcales archaeon]
MTKEIVVEIDMGKYKSVELSVDEAEKLLRLIVEKLGIEPNDVNEAFRILRNFDVFYETQRKKFKDYLVPSKSMNDMILGRVVVDKLKLIKEGGKNRVVVVFDRRVPEETIIEALKELGYAPSVKRYSL